MRGPSIFACLPGLSTHFMLQNFEKSQSNFGVADEALLPPPPPSQEIVAAEVRKKDRVFVFLVIIRKWV
jgi:hypothetical protein